MGETDRAALWAKFMAAAIQGISGTPEFQDLPNATRRAEAIAAFAAMVAEKALENFTHRFPNVTTLPRG